MRDILKRKFVNGTRAYQNIFKKRKIPGAVTQYKTPVLKHVLTDEQLDELTIDTYIWTTGDRLYKIANDYYGDPQYWWIIAWFNLKPTEQHFQAGDIIQIPLPLEQILIFLDYE